MSKKLLVMGSGEGTNFESIVKKLENIKDVEIFCVSNVKDAKILERAKRLKIENLYLKFENNVAFFNENNFDLVALAGYMRILTPETLEKSTFINIHPSLLPAFKGKNAVQRAYDYGVKVSGITIHYVEKNVDEGKIIAQYPVFIEPDMNLIDFENQIHAVEHELYPKVIENILFDNVISYGKCGGCGKCR